MIKLFLSYAPDDREWLQKIDLALQPLQRSETLSLWDDRKILPGQLWQDSIHQALEEADIVVLLISSNYLSSNYLHKQEMLPAMQNRAAGRCIVIPIIIRPCLWESAPIAKLRVLPKDATPLSEQDSIDQAVLDIVYEIKGAAQAVIRKRGVSPTVPDEKTDTKDTTHSGGKPTPRSLDASTQTPDQTRSDPTKNKATLQQLQESILAIQKRLDQLETKTPSSIYANSGQPAKAVKYQVGLSFAGEDREYVSSVAAALLRLGIIVFYDEYETVNLWGKDLYQHLSDVYQNKCQYCTIFISEHYASKLWTRHELRNAQARAFQENREYILPARFDQTPLPGLPETVAYLECRDFTPAELAQVIYQKIRNSDLSVT